jgi:hypothetical protein
MPLNPLALDNLTAENRSVQRGYLVPPIHNMGLCMRPGEDPNAWKHFGPELTQE